MKETKKMKIVKSDKKYFNKSRRKFIKQIGLSYIVASSYSIISLSQFACSDSVSPYTDFTPGSYGHDYPVVPNPYYGF